MMSLINIAKRMMEESNNDRKQLIIEHEFIEKLSFSRFEEVQNLLNEADKDYWLEFPVWARLLTYRFLCLLAPDDPSIKRRAAAGLLSFGPDWDIEAKKLQDEAEAIESIQDCSPLL